jgi:hypothetical protein
MEHRKEFRKHECLAVTIYGRDQEGVCFSQRVTASSLSRSGALLSGITRNIRPGDLIMVDHCGTKSRFKVIWVSDSESHPLMQAAIHLVETEISPWSKQLHGQD